MTKVKVYSGNCGYSTTITAERGEDKDVKITITSECEMVSRMQDDLPTLNMMDAFVGFSNNRVYKSAAKRLKHVACPVPCGILKALEVESGICVPERVTVSFETERD